MVYSKLYRRRFVFAYTWIGILLALFLFIRFIPIISTFYLSLFRWELIRPVKPFIGLQNFTTTVWKLSKKHKNGGNRIRCLQNGAYR